MSIKNKLTSVKIHPTDKKFCKAFILSKALQNISRAFWAKVLQFILQPNKETSTYFPTNIFLFHSKVEHFISKTTTAPLEKNELMPILKKLGIFLKKKDYLLDIKPLLKLVLGKYFGKLSWTVNLMVDNFRNSQEGTKVKVNNYYRN